MKLIIGSMIVVLALSFAGCMSETEKTTTTTTTSQRTSAADTSALDRTRNTNMQPSSYNSMGATPR